MTLQEAEARIDASVIRDYKLDCLVKTGPRKSRDILADTAGFYRELAEEEPRAPGDPAGERLRLVLYPTLAYYRALRKNGLAAEESAALVEEQLPRHAREQADRLRLLQRLPFFRTLFRLHVRRRIARLFPPEGWEIRWGTVSGRKTAFTVCRCLYKERLEALGAPELLPLLCRMETSAAAGLEPKLYGKRAAALALGDVCGFRFEQWPDTDEQRQEPS